MQQCRNDFQMSIARSCTCIIGIDEINPHIVFKYEFSEPRQINCVSLVLFEATLHECTICGQKFYFHQ